MERRKALAVAAAGAMLSASSVVAANAGFFRPADAGATASASGALEPVVVTETRDVYDTVVVPTTPPAARAPGAPTSAMSQVAPMTGAPTTAPTTAPAAPGLPAAPVRTISSPAVAAPTTTTPPAASPRSQGPSPVVTSPPTTASPTTTTVPATTTTTTRQREDVEIPEDWPAGRPLPPMPPGCEEPHLEDNGVWNCGD